MTNLLYKAVFRSMLGRYSVYALNLASMMVLSRVFSPELFGLVAAITVFILFFQMMAEAGLGPAVINLNELNNEDRNGLFGLTIVISFIMAILLVLLEPFFTAFYGMARVAEVVPYMACSLFFFGVNTLPNSLLLRDQAYFKIAICGFLAELISTGGVLLLHFFIDPLHALSIKGLLNASILFMGSWYFCETTEFGRPVPGRKFSAIKPMLNFSAYQFGFNVINYFTRNLDNILVGRYFGADTLGSYDKAYQLMKYPLLLLTFAMTPAIQPVIRHHQKDSKAVEEIHSKFVFNLSIAGGLTGIGIYLFSDWIVQISLGSQWGGVVPIIRILAIAIPVQVVLSTSGSFFHAMGRADLLFYSGIISAVIVVIAILLGILAGDIEVLCWALVVSFHLNFLHTYALLYKRIFKASYIVYLSKMIPLLLSACFMISHFCYFGGGYFGS